MKVRSVINAEGKRHPRTHGVCCALPALVVLGFALPALGQTDVTTDLIERAAQLQNAVNDSSGITQINQDAGTLTNQSNTVASALAGEDVAIADAISNTTLGGALQAETAGVVLGNLARLANIGASTEGVISINQSAGSLTQQANMFALALSANGVAIASGQAEQNALGTPGTNLAESGISLGGTVELINIGAGASGVFAINQDVGLGNGQSNVAAIAIAPEGSATAIALAAPPAPASLDRTDLPVEQSSGTLTISDSFNTASGLVQINQATGAFNRQANLIAVAVGLEASAHALTDSDLDAIEAPPSAFTTNDELDSDDLQTVSNSFEGFSGIAQVNQTSGIANHVTQGLTVTMTRLGGAS